MPQKIIDVPGIGRVSFPDTMSDEAIGAAIQKNLGSKPRAVNPARDLVSTPIAESTMGSRAREAAIGILEPFTAESVANTIGTAARTGYDLSVNPVKGLPELWDMLKRVVKVPIQPLVNFEEGWRTGDYDRAAYGAGGILSQTMPAVAGVVESAAGPIRMGPETPKLDLSSIRSKVRAAGQSMTGATAFKTTKPIVEKATEAAEKFTEATEKNAVKTAEHKAAHNQAVKETLKSNREANIGSSRAKGVERSLEEGSAKLGKRVKDLDSNLRTEAREKYDIVRQAVKNDPGVPLGGLAEAANFAEQNILKGSSENIKQFRELARKAPEEEGIMSGGVLFPPGSRLFEEVKAAGGIDTGGNIPFDELQGYSSELGTKLAKGGLPGDIYQALKYLKEKIDVAKTTIADRNGAGAALRNADSFWHRYMDLFYDSDSALTKVRESVGTLDPEYYADAFTKGKAGDVAISKLKQMKSRHADEASGIADLARNLRSASTELSETKVPKTQPLPERPKPPEPPEPPVAPTAEDIIQAKRDKVQSKASELGQLRRYDLIALSASVIGPLLGSWAREAGLAFLVGEKGFAAALNRPAVIEWLAKPTEADIVAASKLPEPARAQLVNGLRNVIDQEKAAGRSVPVAPSVQRLITNTGIITSPVANRREALDRLGR